VHGSEEELYGDGTITLTLGEALRLAKKLLEAVLEAMLEEEEVKEEEATQ
jgi:predicted RNase H-like HicB family nuclease